ncbi:MAG: TonB-dependent receptor plug domain-containing protein [Flavobacteriales bacterium]|nr:TonB-dependent receptor plug domain-containing protein [Flavobacteriales bacterium]
MRSTILTLLVLSTGLAHAQTDTTRSSTADSLNLTAINNLIFTADQLEAQESEQTFSGLLQSNQDVFMRSAGFNFSAARYRVRGMDGKNFAIMLNGVPMNDPELGFGIWANWGGLNDITRYPETGVGISQNEYAFGGVQGYTNMDLRATSKRPGTRFSYSLSNRTYRNRAMLTHNTGMMDNGLAVSASVSGRWAEEGYIEGTSYSNMSYFLSLEKRLNDEQSIGLIGLGSPSLRGRSSLNTIEAFELRDDNYYNPYWGYQQGEKRNSRMRYSHKPIVMAWHEIQLNDDSKLKSTAYTQFGEYYQTRLDWVDANDPRPDYYRNLPSYLEFINEPDGIDALENAWANDVSFYQLDWDAFYQANYKNLHTVANADGTGEDFQGYRSKYIVEEAHSDPFLLGLNLNYQQELGETKHLVVGLNANMYTSDNYRELNDLLGGEYWLDINRFADGVLPTDQGAQNNLDQPNGIITYGERYGYNYEMHRRNLDLFAQYSEKLPKLDYYLGLSLNAQSFWRDGKFRNELFEDNSKGESERLGFTTGGVKAGATYKITGRHFISANVGLMSRAPLIRNSFLSPRTRNSVVPDLTTEKIASFDLNYQIRFPRFKARVTGYSATIKDQVSIFTFYSDGSNDLINLVTNGIDHSYNGLEIGFEANATSTLTLTGAIGHGQFLYTARPEVTRVIDETDTQEPTELAYMENFRVGRTPQSAINIGFNYRDPKFWFAGMDLNYFANSWIDPISTRRTESSVDGLITDDPQWDRILEQTQLDNAATLNLFAGKSWRFDYKYYLLVTVNVSNVLDKQDYITGGYEQGRPTAANLDLFDNKYAYMFGRTYFAMVRISF